MAKNTVEQIAEVLMEQDDFLIAAHLRADGDAIASVCFFIALLNRLGKKFRVVLDDDKPDNRYDFLSGFDQIASISNFSREEPHNVFIVLDTPNTDRLGRVKELLRARDFVLNIDHHSSNVGFGNINWIDPTASSTCEILVELMDYFPQIRGKTIAEILYTGICFDTGRFRFSNTTSRTFEVASRLAREGISVDMISDRVFYQWSALRIQAMGDVLQNMELHADGRVAILKLMNAFFRKNPEGWKELEGFSDLGISVKGVEISLFFKELRPGYFKVSLRAQGDHDVSRVAGHYNGGGHKKAAGCEVTGEYIPIRDEMLRLITGLPTF